MSKVAIVILADTDTHEGLGRVVNALEAVKEFKDGHDDVQLIFDGAGPNVDRGIGEARSQAARALQRGEGSDRRRVRVLCRSLRRERQSRRMWSETGGRI